MVSETISAKEIIWEALVCLKVHLIYCVSDQQGGCGVGSCDFPTDF